MTPPTEGGDLRPFPDPGGWLYTYRCFDCQRPCDPDKVLCDKCEQMYAERKRR